MSRKMTGAEMIVEALKDQGVDTIFGYPGGAVLPIYDAIFHQNKVKHVLVRHEQGAGHAAEGYARSTGKVGVLLVTSGPGATNAVTALTDAADAVRGRLYINLKRLEQMSFAGYRGFTTALQAVLTDHPDLSITLVTSIIDARLEAVAEAGHGRAERFPDRIH